MHGLILAGGEGTRLAAGGIAVPKPLVEVAGRPQLLRLLETLDALGCESLTCAIRADLPAVAALLDARRFRAPFRVMPCRTPSSLHTLAEALPGVSPGPVFCSMVDTVMRWRDWGEVYRQTEARLAEGADAVLAVTSFVDDESPVYVGRHAGGFVRLISDEPVAPVCVTGGVYGLGVEARHAVAGAVGRGLDRMRGFLQAFVAGGARVATVDVARIIDIDRPSDLQVANAWLTAPDASEPEV